MMKREEYNMIVISISPQKISYEKLLSFLSKNVTTCQSIKNLLRDDKIFRTKLYIEILSEEDGGSPDLEEEEEECFNVKSLFSYDEYIFPAMKILQFKIARFLNEDYWEPGSVQNLDNYGDVIIKKVVVNKDNNNYIDNKDQSKNKYTKEIFFPKLLKLPERSNRGESPLLEKNFLTECNKTTTTTPPSTLSFENRKLLFKNIIKRVGVSKKIIVKKLMSFSKSLSPKRKYNKCFYNNCFVALKCFNHEDKRPSLSLNLLSLHYRCFGCKIKGVINNYNFKNFIFK